MQLAPRVAVTAAAYWLRVVIAAGRPWSSSLQAWPRRLLGAVVAVAAMPGFVAAKPPTQCEVGQQVLYYGSNPGQVEGGNGGSCLVRSLDGRTHTWLPLKQLEVVPPSKSAGGSPDGNNALSAPAPSGVRVFRPTVLNRLVFPADALGHVVLTVMVNDVPIRFIVDTGATLVSLSPTDAKVAGFEHAQLTFDHTVQTSNGPTQAAFVQLREMRVEQLEMENVQAAVVAGLKQSVLGMSFLGRLKGFDMHNGTLRIDW